MSFSVLSVLLLVAGSSQLVADSPNNTLQSSVYSETIRFEHLGMRQGLASSSIIHITQDEDGFIWITGQDGVSRYDGHSITVFNPPSSSGWPEQFSSDKAFVTPNNDIWVGYAWTDVLAKFNHETGDFDYFYMDEILNPPGGTAHVRILGHDEHQNRLWLAIPHHGNINHAWIVTIDASTGELIDVYADEEGESLMEFGNFFWNMIGQVILDGFAVTDDAVWLASRTTMHQITHDGEIRNYVSPDFGEINEETGNSVAFELSSRIFFDRPEETRVRIEVFEIREVVYNGETQLWVTTDYGIFRYDDEKDRFLTMLEFPFIDDFDESGYYSVYQDKEQHIWVGGHQGNFKIEFDGEKHGEPVNLQEDPALNFTRRVVLIPHAENDRYIWFVNGIKDGSFNGTAGLNVYDKVEKSFTLVQSNSNSDETIQSNEYISRVHLDDFGGVWVSDRYSGLSFFNPNRTRFSDYIQDQDIRDDLGAFSMFHATEDEDGNIWSGSMNGRVYVNKAETDESVVFLKLENLRHPGQEGRNWVMSLYVEQPGVIWLATEWSGLQRIQFNQDTFEIMGTEIWIPNSGDDGYYVGIPQNFARVNENEIVIGTSVGIAIYYIDEGRFESVGYGEGGVYTDDHNYGNWSFKDSRGYVWFHGNNRTGARRINPETLEIKHLNQPENTPDSLVRRFSTVTTLFEDRNGDIIIGEPLMKLDRENDYFVPFFEGEYVELNIYNQFEDGSYITAMYGTGVFILSEEGEILKRIYNGNGLSSNYVTSVNLDVHENLWIFHALGISFYNRENDVVVNYDYNHGLDTSSETPFRMHHFPSGRMMPVWIGNTQKILFHPDEIRQSASGYPLKITQARVGDKVLPLNTIENAALVKDRNSEITITFTAPTFDEAEKQEFRYRLGKADADWSAWSRNRELTLASLAPGGYTAEIQTRDGNQLVNPQTVQYAFYIQPPWYATIWAQMFWLILLFAVAGYGAIRLARFRTEQESIRLKAEQSEELARIDRVKTGLMLNISHELRTPLPLIMAPLEQIRQLSSAMGEQGKRYSEVAWNNVKRLHQLVEQVLDLTRLELGELKMRVRPISVNVNIKRLIDFFESYAEQNQVKLHLVGLETDRQLYVDTDKFEKIIFNLLSNAIKFSNTGDVVTVRLAETDSRLKIEVVDTGRGMDEQTMGTIFERFSSNEETQVNGMKGLGIGLSIAREYVTLHAGQISVESELGKGSTFIVVLPFGKAHFASEVIDEEVADEEYAFTATVSSAPAAPKGTLTKRDETVREFFPGKEAPLILIVEDNRELAGFIRDVLADTYRVEIASNGSEGIKQTSLLRPDLVITDIMMPEIDGFGVLAHIRDTPEFALLPVIILSARSELEDRIRGFEIGVNAYLSKPFNTTELLVRIDNLLRLKQERDSAREELGESSQDDYVNESDLALIKKLEVYVLDRLSNSDVTAEELATAVNQSRSNLYRNLKTTTGFTPAEFVREVKLREAERMLSRNPGLRMIEVATKVGFSNTSYFSRLYKKRFSGGV